MAAAEDGAGPCVTGMLEADTVVLLAEIETTLVDVLDWAEITAEERLLLVA